MLAAAGRIAETAQNADGVSALKSRHSFASSLIKKWPRQIKVDSHFLPFCWLRTFLIREFKNLLCCHTNWTHFNFHFIFLLHLLFPIALLLWNRTWFFFQRNLLFSLKFKFKNQEKFMNRTVLLQCSWKVCLTSFHVLICTKCNYC